MTNQDWRRSDGPWRKAKDPSIDSRPTGGAIRSREPETLVAWADAVCERHELQARIVRAFRDHVEAGGQGPSEADLMLFAQTAIAEQRLARGLNRTHLAPVSRRR